MHLPSPRNLFKWVCLLPLVSVASCCFPALCPSSGAWWKCWHRKSDVHLSISSSFRLVLFPPRVGIQETSSFPREILVFNSKIQQKILGINVVRLWHWHLLWTIFSHYLVVDVHVMRRHVFETLFCCSVSLPGSYLRPSSFSFIYNTIYSFYGFEFYGQGCSFFPTCFCCCC